MSEDKKEMAELHLMAYVYRGQIINDFIHLERLIDECLKRYFCDDKNKQSEFFELIIASERIGFSNKIDVFQYLFKKHQDYFKDIDKNVCSELRTLIDERNMCAHFLLDTSSEGIEKFKSKNEISFVKFRNSIEKIYRNKDTLVKSHKTIGKYISQFSNLLETV